MAAATSRVDNETARLANPPMACSGQAASIDRFSRYVASTQSADAAASDLNWHVARNVGESERRVRERLEGADYESYFPLIRELRPVPKRQLSHAQRASGLPLMREVLAPLFPRYLFIRFSTRDRRWHDIFATLGLVGLLCKDRLPVPRPFPEAIVQALQASEIDDALPGSMPVRELAIRIGEEVRISDGPLAGHIAIVEDLGIVGSASSINRRNRGCSLLCSAVRPWSSCRRARSRTYRLAVQAGSAITLRVTRAATFLATLRATRSAPLSKNL